MAYKVAVPRLKRSEITYEEPFFDRIYSGQQLEQAISAKAKRRGSWASTTKTLLIILGALTAAKPAVDQVIGKDNVATVVTFALFGVLTASLAGLLAAYKWDEASGRLRTLATETSSWVREFETHWENQVVYQEGAALKTAIAKALDDADKKLRELEQKAAENQVVAERPLEPTIQHITRGWNSVTGST